MNWTVGRDAAEVSLPAFELPGLESLVGEPADRIEPEYVTFDPRSRFAIVTLQENDAFVDGGPERRQTDRRLARVDAAADGQRAGRGGRA